MATVSEEETSRNVEEESAEMIETNSIKLSCDPCKYKCKKKTRMF